MQKYKTKPDSCGPTKSSKHQIASISSNKSLIKQPSANQNKSTLSILNSSDVNHSKSLRHKNKSSKHLETNTFTNNTHQNSVNLPVNSKSHNNSKSNKKDQNQKKKSTGKKIPSSQTQSKLLAETALGHSSSQYQNLSVIPNQKNDSKNYKNILKIRKQGKEQQIVKPKQIRMGSKPNKDLKQSQAHQKSVNVQLKKKTSKSRSKSKEFQKLKKKSNLSKKHLTTEPSHMTSKQNNINQGNQKKSQLSKKNEKPSKSISKQKSFINKIQNRKTKEKIATEFDDEDYQRVPYYILKSSTNSDIEFSNADENTVKDLIMNQQINNKAYIYEGQLNDVVYCRNNDYGEDMQVVSKKQSHKLSKRYSKMNLQLSSECLNCLTEPDYAIEPKGIRHLNGNFISDQQEIRSSKNQTQFSKKHKKSCQTKQLSQFRHKRCVIDEQTLEKSAIVIQKVWRGYMTRKLLQRYIEEEELRLIERMKELDKKKREAIESYLDGSENEDYQQCQREQDRQGEEINITKGEVCEQNPQRVSQQVMNHSLNPLDYESEILPRDEPQTISFIGDLNNIDQKHCNLQHQIELKLSNQSADEVLYTSVQSIEHLSKVENIYGENQDILINHDYESEFLNEKEQSIANQFHYQNYSSQQHPLQQQNQVFRQNQGQKIKENQFREIFNRQSDETQKKYNFFNNSQSFQHQQSRSYQQPEFNEPSSIMQRPVQQSYDFSSINKLSASKINTDSYFINESVRQQSMSKMEIPEKSVDLEESSYCLADQTEPGYQKYQQSQKQQKENLNQSSYQNHSSGSIQELKNAEYKSHEVKQKCEEKKLQVNKSIENPLLQDNFSQESYKLQNNQSHLEQIQISKNDSNKVTSDKAQQTDQLKQNQIQSDLNVLQSLIPNQVISNKSNPNILLIKSPKHQISSKSSFSQSKSHKKDTSKENQQNFKKSSSLKEFFFKKSLLGNQILGQKDQIQFPVPSFSNHKLDLLAQPTQKQASSIESLLHFRHQCLTHQHSTDFKQIQQLYVKQKISKQQFIIKLQKLAENFEQEAISIKQVQKDIFNGYKALLKLIKDVVKDCKTLGFSQQKGSNVRFCRSMEIFFREKDNMGGQKCIFDDQHLWRFDEVMIDQLQRSKQRVFSNFQKDKNGKQQKSEKKVVKSQNQVIQKSHQKQECFSMKKEQKIFQKENKKIDVVHRVEQKQLSRQSLSHHQLPQFFQDVKPQKQNSESKINFKSEQGPKRKVFQISPEKDLNVDTKKQKQVFVQPCSFDVSDLGSYDDDQFDQDQQGMEKKDKIYDENLQQSEPSFPHYQMDDSKQYEINDDQSFVDKSNEQCPINSKDIDVKDKQQSEDFSKQKEKQRKAINQLIDMQNVTDQYVEETQIQSKIIGFDVDIQNAIVKKNKQFLQRDDEDKDLMDEDDSQTVPVIKREVYQLSCDSDEEQGNESNQPQQQTPQLNLFNRQKKVISSNFFKRSGSVPVYDHRTQEEIELSAKYSNLIDFVYQILVWEFVQDIVVNKNKPQSKSNFGKKLSDMAKNYSSSIKDESYFDFQKNQNSFKQTNIVIINNNHEDNRRKKIKSTDQFEKSQSNLKQSLSKINGEEINDFLQILYKNFPTFNENQSKLCQRMYPSPLQLLKSLRDTSMEDYFDYSNRKRKEKSDENSSKSQDHSNQQNEDWQKSYSDGSNMDSETSYLELGSYEFLLSQQLCEQLIEKYISEVYDIQMDKKLKKEKSENVLIQKTLKQYQQYLEMKNVMTGAMANKKEQTIFQTQKSLKQGSFQSIIRTRQLFLQHKEIQSQMLRKQILKIELHTILDSMNEELIKERQSKCGYSGIGLSELALGTIERSGVQITNEQDYGILVNKAKYRLEKFVLNQQVNLNDKLLLQCQQSVTINDSQWIFYVTEALQFGLQIAKIIQEHLWEETVREISKMKMKRKFRLDDSWIVKKAKVEQLSKDQIIPKQPSIKGKKVISINIVDSSERQTPPDHIHKNPPVQSFEVEQFKQNQSQSIDGPLSYEQEKKVDSQSEYNDFDEEIVQLPLKKSNNSCEKQQEILQTVRNENPKSNDKLIESTSPIQDEGFMNNINESSSHFSSTFNHSVKDQQKEISFHHMNQQNFEQGYSQYEFDTSNVSMPKMNDDSKSFEDSQIENIRQSSQGIELQEQQKQQQNKHYQQERCQENFQDGEEGSYQIDEDSMGFDDELDKELDQMNQ